MSRWYAKVPKEPAANRHFRRELLKESVGSQDCRDWLWHACADDILFYMNAFYWTFDPRNPDGEKVVPFITYGFQDEAIRGIEKSIDTQRDLVIEKSRDMGASWMCLSVFEHKWHFRRDNTFYCLSRNEDAVDGAKDEDALFPKIDRIHRLLPDWLMPRGYPGTGRFQYRTRKSLFNPATGSSIKGGATVGDAAVGGRRTAILLDEFSRVEEGYEIDLGTADVTPCRIFNFTAYGTGNAAYDLLKNPHKKKLRLHWSADPRKNAKLYKWDDRERRIRHYKYEEAEGDIRECDPHRYGPEDADTRNFDPPGRPFEYVRDGILRSPVYDAEERRRGSRRYMAIMWDIDYEGSDQRFFDQSLLTELAREFCCRPYWEGDLAIDSATGELHGLQEKEGGPLRLWCRLSGERPPASPMGYAAGTDLSRGRGATNSCCSFVDVNTGEKVAEYVRPDEKPEVFAAKVYALGNLFLSTHGSQALIAWERVGPGSDFGDTLEELGYSNVYREKVVSKANSKFRGRPTDKPGWTPKKDKAADLLGEYQIALSQRKFINRSAPALAECEKYVFVPGGVEYQDASGSASIAGDRDHTGARENHGDRVVADALACRAAKSIGGIQQVDRRDDRPADDVPGTLAWRRKVHAAREREREETWS
jgi:hypothetical protein